MALRSTCPIIVGTTESGAAIYVPDPPRTMSRDSKPRGPQQTGVSALLSIKFTVGDCSGETEQR